MKWQVETEKGRFEAVMSAEVYVSEAGALAFMDEQGSMFLVYAAGSWRSMFRDEDGAE